MSSFAHLRHGPRDAVCSPSPIHSGVCRLSDKVHVCTESFKESCFFFFSFFFTAGVLISVAPVLHDILLGSLIKRLCKPAYTEALNSVNYKPPSAFATAENYRWMRKVGGGLFSRRHHFPPSIFDAPCRWHADGMNIHEFAEGLYVSQWFPPVSSGYANCILTSPYGRRSPN